MAKQDKSKESKDLIKEGMLFDKPIRVNSIRSARRLLGKAILCFQSGTITDRQAKTISYLVQNYVNLIRNTEFEERVEKIELLTNEIIANEGFIGQSFG